MKGTISSTDKYNIESAPSDTFAALRDVVSLYHERAAAAGVDGILVLFAVCPNLDDPKEGEKKPKEEKEVHHFEIGDVEGMIRKAIELREFGNIWLGPALYRRGISSRSRGRKEDIIAVLGLVIDDDGDGDTDKRAVRPKGIAETIEITTSTKPAINLQPHFIFHRALPPDEANTLAELFHKKCGGDHGTKDISHVWRLPDLLNFPNRKKLGRGRPIEPQEVALTGGSWELIDPDDLRRELESMPDPDPPKDKKKRKAKSNGSSGNGYAPPMGSVHPDDLPLPDWLARDIYTEDTDDRSKHCCKTMLNLMERNLDNETIRHFAHIGKFADKFVDRGDLDDEIARVRENVWTGEIKFDLLAFHNKQQRTASNGASNGSGHEGANSAGKASAPPMGHNKPPLEATLLEDFGKRPPREPVIQHVAAMKRLDQSFGQPETGKSLIELHKDLCICTGKDFGPFGVEKRGGVIWLALEDAQGVEDKATAWCQHYGVDGPLPFACVEEILNLRDGEVDLDRICELWVRMDRLFKERFGLPAVRISIDTYILSLAGGDPNSGKDSGAWALNAKKLIERTGCSLGVINHAGKDESRGASGSNFLFGALDMEFRTSMPKDGQIRLENTKNRVFGKWRKGGKPFAIGFERIDHPFTHPETGETYDLPVAVATDKAPARRKASDAPNTNQAAILKALDSALVDQGKPSPGGADFPVGVIMVRREALKREVLAQPHYDKPDQFESPQAALEFNRTLDQRMRDGIGALIKKELLGGREGWFWKVSPS